MRTLILDQFEFDHPDSEEGLEISLAARSDFPFSNLATFAAAVLSVEAARKLPAAVQFQERFGQGHLREYLQRYAGMTLPKPCDWPSYVLSDGPDDWDGLLVGPAIFIHYHWWTSA